MTPWTERVIAEAGVRSEWLAARQHYLTASDVANVLGLGAKSRGSVLSDKLSGGKVVDGMDPGDLAMVAAGRYLEAGIFTWFASETLHETAMLCGALIRHPDVSWLAGTPDALLDDEPVEIKLAMHESRPNWHVGGHKPVRGWPAHLTLPSALVTRGRFPPTNARVAAVDRGTPRGDWRALCGAQHALLPELGPPSAPLAYWVQLQVQMQLLGVEGGWIVGCMAGTGRYDLYYARDRAFEDWMLWECELFLQEAEHAGWRRANGVTVERVGATVRRRATDYQSRVA